MLHPEIQVNLVSSNGWSALMWAAYHGSEGVVKLLLQHPAIQVNLANDGGSTALLLAAKYGRKGVVKCLLTADDVTAIKMSAENGHEAIVRLLLGAPNIDITIRSITDGHTAMSAARAKGHIAIVNLLQDFESRKSSMAGPPETSRLPLLDEDSSDSDSGEDYYDAEEGGSEGDLELSVLTFD
ncbi:ankyrin repeat-containing domain protein [Coprinopsis sp. MPI-PUGE-AT-0042]|nr:ankyrin repeat-containing domain protein [Coprinopsis sp. MPI-PUGE-AT-0042]